MYRRILIANRGSLDADGALEPSLTLARLLGAELHMLFVEELSRFPVTIAEVTAEKREAGRQAAFIIASVQRRTQDAKIQFFSHVVIGRFVERVVDFVTANQIDLLIIGSINRSWIEAFFVGDTIQRLIEQVPCALHIVKRQSDRWRRRRLLAFPHFDLASRSRI